MVDFKMSDSVVSMIFLGVLGVLFLLLVVLTIVLIVTRKKNNDEDYEEDYQDYSDEEYDDDGQYSEEYADESEENTDEEYIDEEYADEEYSEEEYADEGYADETYDEEYADEYEENEASVETSDDVLNENEEKTDVLTSNVTVSEEADVEEIDDVNSEKTIDISDVVNKVKAANKAKTAEVSNAQEASDAPEVSQPEKTEAAVAENLDNYIDSAFAPYTPDESLSNEAIMASVREAEEISEAVMYGKPDAEAIFGLSDQLDSYSKKKTVKKSTVSSSEDFYWYNKMDVAEKPSYKTKEMYYHYFNVPKDCIEDLLVEMYDCALVRTEEIRYIAYGIEPKAVSIKDILSEGNYYYSDQPKKKEPLPQDLIKIYEKWCGYVDKLMDKIEIHADEFTIQEIRRLLCEFGRNDVDVLIEGK